MDSKRGGRVRVYASAQDRHRAFRLRRGVKVKKPVVLADRSVRKTDKGDEQRSKNKTA